METETNKNIVRSFFEEIWNRWNLDAADELVSPSIRFRGSLGRSVEGLEGFKSYVRFVLLAFPDFQNTIEELVAEGDRVVARLSFSGTHRGEALGIAPTGRSFTYAAAAFFRLAHGRIVEGWVLGDLSGLRAQLTGEAQSPP